MIEVDILNDSNGSWKTIKTFDSEYIKETKYFFFDLIPWTYEKQTKSINEACMEAVNFAKTLTGIVRVRSVFMADVEYYKNVWYCGQWLCSVYDI